MREKRIKKLKVKCKAIVVVSIYMVTVAIMKIYTSLAPLMCVIFGVKCVKLSTFFYFERTDAVALRLANFLIYFFHLQTINKKF